MSHYGEEVYWQYFEEWLTELYDYFEREGYDPLLYSELEVGIYVHDKKIEILGVKNSTG